MNVPQLVQFYNEHKGGIVGIAIGFLAAVCFLWLGLFKTIFIAACIIVGYHMGEMITKDKNYIKYLLNKFLPPGTYR